MRPVTVSVTRGSSVLPSVATEIFCAARLMVTASSDGSWLKTSMTERARQMDLSGEDIAGGSVGRLIGALYYVYCETVSSDDNPVSEGFLWKISTFFAAKETTCGNIPQQYLMESHLSRELPLA